LGVAVAVAVVAGGPLLVAVTTVTALAGEI
jgi:hypothetical protein